MNIALYTHDLNVENGYLMPWGTVLEVGACLSTAGHSAMILSGVSSEPGAGWTARGVRVREVRKPKNRHNLEPLGEVCREERIEVLYWPLDWRRARTDLLSLERVGLQVVWYIPGAWYGLRQVMRAMCLMRSCATLSYLAQVLAPKHRFVRALLAQGARPLITMTDCTRDKLIQLGYPCDAVAAIPPGKEPLPAVGGPSALFNRWREALGDDPYFLFFGPPQAIRGVGQMLSAFQQVAQNHASVRLVCLFRADPGVNTTSWQQRVSRLPCRDRIVAVWESVNRGDLAAFLSGCHAVLQPFLLVPSEIPLAVIESAGYGKPVISTGPSGTGLFAQQFGLMVPPGNAKALAEAMMCLLTNKALYADKCRAALRVYENHPTWDMVAARWLAAANVN